MGLREEGQKTGYQTIAKQALKLHSAKRKKALRQISMNVSLILVYDLFSKVTCLEQQGIHC